MLFENSSRKVNQILKTSSTKSIGAMLIGVISLLLLIDFFNQKYVASIIRGVFRSNTSIYTDTTFTIYLFFNIIKVIVLLFFLGYLIRDYLREKYSAYMYLIIFMVLLIINQYQEINNVRNPQMGIGGVGIHLQTAMITFIAVLFFFSSFEGNTVLTKSNTVILMIASLLEGLLLIFGNLIRSVSIPGQGQSQTTDIGNTDLLIMDITMMINIVSIFFIMILLVILLRKITHIKEKAYSMYATNLIVKVQWGAKIMIFGPILASILFLLISDLTRGIQINIITSVISIIGLFLIVKNFREGGIPIFQGDNLRRLILINESGIPIYSYGFKHFNEDKADQDYDSYNDDDILFSGALTSISMLMSEFTGSSRKVQSISLSGLKMMIYHVIEKFSVVLLVTNETLFYRNAMDKFSSSIPHILENLDKLGSLNISQIKEMNHILESSFGQNIDWSSINT